MKKFLIAWLKEALAEWIQVSFNVNTVTTVLKQAVEALKKKAEETDTPWDDYAIAGVSYIILNTGNIERFVKMIQELAAGGNICAAGEPGTIRSIAQEIAPLFVEWAKTKISKE